MFVSLREADKPGIVEPLKAMIELGFKIIATGGTQRFLAAHGVAATKVNKVSEARPHAADAVRNGGVQPMFNTTEGATSLAELEAAAPRRPLAKDAVLHHSLGRDRCGRGRWGCARPSLKSARCKTLSGNPGAPAPGLLFDSWGWEQVWIGFL